MLQVVNITDQFQMVFVSVDLFAVRIPDENVSIAAAGVKLLIAIVEGGAVDSVKMSAQSIDNFAGINVDYSYVATFRDKDDSIAMTKRRRQTHFRTNLVFVRRISFLEFDERRLGVPAGGKVPASELRFVSAERKQMKAVVAERQPVGRPAVSLLGRVRFLFFRFLLRNRNVVEIKSLEAASRAPHVPEKNLSCVAAAGEQVVP